MTEDAMRGVVAEKLRHIGVPPAMLRTAIRMIPDKVSGVLVYGSRARGDYLAESDLDLLGLVEQPRRTVHEDEVGLSFYTAEQLKSGIGSLFGAHLARNAHILWDPRGLLAACIAEMGNVDTERLLERARFFAQVLGSRDYDLPKYLAGLVREARYLLRSCLYAQSIAEGNPCFSVREIAALHHDERLVELLASRPSGEASDDDLQECCIRLERIIGPLPANRHGSLEALVVNEWWANVELVAMALLALGGSNADSDYTEVAKVLL
jgi:predicted nucleotidyltransferase